MHSSHFLGYICNSCKQLINIDKTHRLLFTSSFTSKFNFSEHYPNFISYLENFGVNVIYNLFHLIFLSFPSGNSSFTTKIQFGEHFSLLNLIIVVHYVQQRIRIGRTVPQQQILSYSALRTKATCRHHGSPQRIIMCRISRWKAGVASLSLTISQTHATLKSFGCLKSGHVLSMSFVDILLH